MLLAALLDAGAGLPVVQAGLARLAVEPVGLELDQVRRHGLRAARARVRTPASRQHRTLPDVTAVIDSAGLPSPVTDFAIATFTRLAAAEARVHGVTQDRVHFHEVGALDAIVDVVGCALALHDLDLLDGTRRVVSPVAVGSGTTRTEHGRLPVPVPAVLEQLVRAGAPVAAHPAPGELCTPTGAALLATLATSWGAPPAGSLRAVGVGAGGRDPTGHPNVLRVLVGEHEPAAAGWSESTLWQVEATVDDLDPRIWPDLLEQLRASGAADAWCTPVLMRKGRPGQVLSVLARADLRDLVTRIIFTETASLGVRAHPVQRRSLRRDQVRVPVAGGEVPVKRGLLGDRVVTVQPEYAEARELARRAGVPVAEVIAEARAAADALPPAAPPA
jgi:hypothetical protein